jgi:predicted enzyme related to lactoylglutathione lyase
MWVDLTTSDLAASVRFYSELFGWKGEDQGEAMGHYTLFFKDGKMVAAATPPMDPNTPSMWSTYVSTADANATAQAVRDAGGQVVVEPMVVGDQGSMACFLDPTGAFICVWQPGQHKGAELANEPGSFTWNELQTRDLEAAKRFYPKVFGLGIKDNPMPGGGSYVEWQVNGKSIAGAMTMSPQIPPNVPSNWLVYFAVDDPDAALARVTELGGRSLMPAMDSPAGRFAVVSDPVGAAFAVIKVQR